MGKVKRWGVGLWLVLSIGALPAAAFAAASDAALLKEVKEYKAYFAPLPDHLEHPKNNPGTAIKIELGRNLYFDTRLSITRKISCNTCHQLDRFGVDNEATSLGHAGKRGSRNSPTVYNSGLNFKQFWDGRAEDLEAQAIGPILNPVEMGMPSESGVLERIGSIPWYQEAFKKAFPGEKQPLTYKNLGRAIAAYERTLLTPSRFDKFLKGDDQALSVEEMQGLKKFVETGCTTCHNGVGVGGHHFQKLGQIKGYKTTDQGRFEVTHDEDDRLKFKVPSLRNVAKTAPYFHDGSLKTLDETIHTMAEYQLGTNLSHEEVQSIAAFLGSLTGELPKDALKPPALPPDGPKTPSL